MCGRYGRPWLRHETSLCAQMRRLRADAPKTPRRPALSCMRLASTRASAASAMTARSICVFDGRRGEFFCQPGLRNLVRLPQGELRILLLNHDDCRPVATCGGPSAMPMTVGQIDSCNAWLGRDPIEQVGENLKQALRVLDLVPNADSDYTPHPLVVLRAEIENARRYLAQHLSSHPR